MFKTYTVIVFYTYTRARHADDSPPTRANSNKTREPPPAVFERRENTSKSGPARRPRVSGTIET